MSCLQAFEKNGDTMVGTLYPGPCEPEQTTSSVPSPGIIVEHNNVTSKFTMFVF